MSSPAGVALLVAGDAPVTIEAQNHGELGSRLIAKTSALSLLGKVTLRTTEVLSA
jgi:hypothetical protein